VVISNEFAAKVSCASVGDEVTDSLIEESSSAVTEDSEVSFVYEIAERIFVLRHYL